MPNVTPSTPTASRGDRESFLDVYRDEHERTMRVLRAYPRDQAEFRPHPKSQTARELVWTFVLEQGAMQTVMTTGFDFSKPLHFPPAPASFDAVVQAFEDGYRKTTELVGAQRDDQFHRPVQFLTGPGQISDLPLHHVLWFMLHDQIHHRGQLTVYLRMVGGKVPSVYGPSLDEPWM